MLKYALQKFVGREGAGGEEQDVWPGGTGYIGLRGYQITSSPHV